MPDARPAVSLRTWLVPGLIVMACFTPAFAWIVLGDSFFAVIFLVFGIPVMLLFGAAVVLWALAGSVVALVRRIGGRPAPRFAVRSWGALLGLVVATGLVLAPPRLAEHGVAIGANYARFDPVRWQAQDPATWTGGATDRQKMLRHLEARVLPGKTEAEIVALLGPSLDTFYFAGSDKDLIYLLGPQRGPFGIDSEWLLIWIGEDGRFARCEVAGD